jgi:hypothetical protein
LQGSLARVDLWQELQLLEKLLYKNKNQHQGAQHFQRLQEVRFEPPLVPPLHCPLETIYPFLNASKPLVQAPMLLVQVRRLLGLLRSMQLTKHVGDFHAAFQGAKQRGALPDGSVLMAYG